MKSVLIWIKQNPQTIKSFMAVLLAWIGKIYLASTGKTASLGVWGDVVNQGIDVLVGIITIYGVTGGIIHVSRGPALTSMDQAATIVSAIKGPTVSESIAEVKAAVEVINSDISSVLPKPPPNEPMDITIHKF